MALIDLFLARRVKRGQLTVHHADGKTSRFGTADPAFNDVTIRCAVLRCICVNFGKRLQFIVDMPPPFLNGIIERLLTNLRTVCFARKPAEHFSEQSHS